MSNPRPVRSSRRPHLEPSPSWRSSIGPTKASDKGMCCSFADGFSVSDVDWDMHDGHYRVLLHGEWIDVPDTSVTRPNRYGPAVVWPYMDDKGNTNIRFLPGTSA